VVARAREILVGLERDELSRGGRPSLSGRPSDAQQQMGLFQAPASADDPLRRRLRDLDVNQLTPLQALTLLAELKSGADE
jgi:DNA mismatch repair protein MutS